MSELNRANKPGPTKIWVSAKRTINTGNYESAAFEAGIEISLGEDAKLKESYERAYDICQKEIIRAAMKSGVITE